MESGASDQHDLAAQQDAAERYQPTYNSPPIGDKTDSAAITQEYARADPVYVEKTVTLPNSYSHYRPVRGDGNCGWRAIGYAYFEKLIEGGDRDQVEGEATRLLSLNPLLESVGGYSFVEDFAEEMISSLRAVAQSIHDPVAAHSTALSAWNDEDRAVSMIYYLRLLAATFLKNNGPRFDPFVPDGANIHMYCQQSIEPVDREIEQLGITALSEVLLKPLNYTLEIAYLDRSPGSQVNCYRFPEESNDQDPSALGPIIYLLYRPDHYDILYRDSPSPIQDASVSGLVNLQVNRVASFTNTDFTQAHESLGTYATLNYGPLGMMIPGLNSSMPAPQASQISPEPSPMMEVFPQPSPWGQSECSPVSSSQHNSITGPGSPLAPSTSTPLTPQTVLPGTGLPPTHATTGALVEELGENYHIRFSRQHVEYHKKNHVPDQNCVQTSTFKNSVWNRAHFGNPNFHPEEWSPDEDAVEGRVLARRKARRSG